MYINVSTKQIEFMLLGLAKLRELDLIEKDYISYVDRLIEQLKEAHPLLRKR